MTGFERRRTRPVKVGPVTIGGGAPVSIQSMTKVPTRDVDTVLAQIDDLTEAGCEIVRLAVPQKQDALALVEIVRRSPIPIVADIHFNAELALMALDAGVPKIRLNPGNIRSEKDLVRVAKALVSTGAAVRVGANEGSMDLRKGLVALDSGNDPAEEMVEQALGQARLLESHGVGNIVLAFKSSNPAVTVRANRLAAKRCDYPFHLGVTEAGTLERALVRSAVGIGTLLMEGIGDTVRVSITGPPRSEVRAAERILASAGLRKEAVQVWSCPTCGRTEVDVAKLTGAVEKALEELGIPVRAAVMGCVVNGPGEAKSADVAIIGGKGFGYIVVRGKLSEKIPETELLDRFLDAVRGLA